MYDVALFSAFGRGLHQARKAAQEGLKVCWVDVSQHLGAGWWGEDIEGPKGTNPKGASLKEASLKGTNLNEVHDGSDYFDKAGQGLCCWPSQGPLLFEQSETLYKLQQWGCSPEVVEYLQLEEGEARALELQKQIQQQSFDAAWLAYLSHHLGSSVYHASGEAFAWPRRVLFFQPFYVRRSTHRGRQNSLNILQQQGVQLVSYKPKSLQATGGLVRGLECEEGLIGAKKYLWFLSSEETHFVSPQIAASLFTQVLKPEWQWMRYRVHIKGSACVQQLPLSTVMLRDIYLSWTHANLCWLQRDLQEDVFDVWMLLPYHARFDKAYLGDMFKQAKLFIEGRVPGAQMKLHLGPVETRYNYQQLGPSRWPVWAAHGRESFIKAKNLQVCTPIKEWL